MNEFEKYWVLGYVFLTSWPCSKCPVLAFSFVNATYCIDHLHGDWWFLELRLRWLEGMHRYDKTNEFVQNIFLPNHPCFVLLVCNSTCFWASVSKMKFFENSVPSMVSRKRSRLQKLLLPKPIRLFLNYIYSTSDGLFTRAAIYFPVASDELILGRAALDLADLRRGSLGLPQQYPKQWPIFSPKLSVLIDLDMTTILPQYCYNVYKRK